LPEDEKEFIALADPAINTLALPVLSFQGGYCCSADERASKGSDEGGPKGIPERGWRSHGTKSHSRENEELSIR
jgi:hypothetical protein